MKKILLFCTAFITALSFASFASAQDTVIYSVEAYETVGEMSAGATVDGEQVLEVSGTPKPPMNVSNIGRPMRPLPPPPGSDGSSSSKPLRETNKQLIERIRAAKKAGQTFEMGQSDRKDMRIERFEGNGMASGSIRVYHIENSVPGKPIMFRASSTMGTSTPHGFYVRSIAASGSRAIFLRSGSSSDRMMWFNSVPRFEGGGTTTIDENGNVMFRAELKKEPQVRQFVNKVFNLLRNVSRTEGQ